MRFAFLKLFLAKITRNLSFNRYKEKHREKRGGSVLTQSLEALITHGEVDLSAIKY